MILFLYGFRNAGKTTLGKKLAVRLKLPFFDTDALLEKREKKSVREIYLESADFALKERKVILSLKEGIVSLGAQTILDQQNQKILKELGFLFFLDTEKEVLKKRFLENPPGYVDQKDLGSSFEKLYTERVPIYEQLWQATLSGKSFALRPGVSPTEKQLASSLMAALQDLGYLKSTLIKSSL